MPTSSNLIWKIYGEVKTDRLSPTDLHQRWDEQRHNQGVRVMTEDHEAEEEFVADDRSLDIHITAATTCGFIVWEGGKCVAALSTPIELAEYVQRRARSLHGEAERERRGPQRAKRAETALAATEGDRLGFLGGVYKNPTLTIKTRSLSSGV